MQVDSVIKALIAHSGMSGRGISAALGQSPAWARKASQSKDSMLSTVARVADIAGVDIALIDRETGEELWRIEPPAED